MIHTISSLERNDALGALLMEYVNKALVTRHKCDIYTAIVVGLTQLINNKFATTSIATNVNIDDLFQSKSQDELENHLVELDHTIPLVVIKIIQQTDWTSIPFALLYDYILEVCDKLKIIVKRAYACKYS